MEIASPAAIAIRLADEGVPLRAIARATDIPSTRLYETLTIAKMEGRLLNLPRDDWPAGCPRDQRSLQLSRMVLEDHDTLMLAIQDVFGITLVPARLLLLLVQHDQVPHARVDVDHKSLLVHICKIRKALKKFDLGIRTLWGFGYQVQLADRRRIMDIILERMAVPA